EADDFGAAALGLVALDAQAGGIAANGIDAAGKTTWSTLLSPRATAAFSRPFAREDGGVELLVQEPSAASTPECGHSPRLLELDASGAIAGELQACTQPVAKDLWDIDALPDVGALAKIGR